MRILAVGDVVGVGGTEYLRRNLWNIRKEYKADLVIVNGENSAKGNGIDKNSADTLLVSGADIITTGNHVWKKHSFKHEIEDEAYVIRPANYPSSCPGEGYIIFDVLGTKVLIINLLGNVYMQGNFESPFITADRILNRQKGEYDLAVVDMHAEATSEKIALAKYLNGRVSVLFGTHTHVQTNDAQILPCGTGYITDLGMVGVGDSILGVKSENVLEMFLTQMPVTFNEAEGDIVFCGAFFEVDEKTGKCIHAQAVKIEG